jgi:hypothetical protein
MSLQSVAKFSEELPGDAVDKCQNASELKSD